MAKRIVVVGSGDVGLTLAILIDRAKSFGWFSSDISVVLLDFASAQHHGAAAAAAVNHATGFEYFRPHHLRSGQMCIQGALTKALLFPPGLFRTRMPNRFYVSRESASSGEVPFAEFLENSRELKAYFSTIFRKLARDLGITELEASQRIGYGPEDFGSELLDEDIPPVDGVVGGWSSAGGAVNMASVYALKRAALERAKKNGTVCLDIKQQEVKSIRRRDDLTVVTTDGGAFEADVVILSAANGNPQLSLLTGGASQPGTYYLNATMYLVLPATSDLAFRFAAARTNFVLQGEHGCMYSCILAPTETRPGIAATYYPSPRGSQVDEHHYWYESPATVPAKWYDAMLNHGVHGLEERASRIFAQACRFNPFLKGYAQQHSLVVRPVFSPHARENPGGTDRRTREMPVPLVMETNDRVIAMTSPKWTTVELAALTLMQKMLKTLNERSLPTSEHGLGPYKLDLVEIQKTIHMRDEEWNREYALEYAADMGFPEHFAPESPMD